MNKVYSDGSYYPLSRLGAYCIVVTPHNGQSDWYVRAHDNTFSNDVEVAGLREAIQIAHNLSLKNSHQSVAFCDSKNAIKMLTNLANNQGVVLKYIPGHTLNKLGNTIVISDLKAQHWCDVMARQFITERLDKKHKRA